MKNGIEWMRKFKIVTPTSSKPPKPDQEAVKRRRRAEEILENKRMLNEIGCVYE